MKPICKRIAKVEQRIHQIEGLSWRVSLRRQGYDPEAISQSIFNHIVGFLQSREQTVEELKREYGTQAIDFDSQAGQALLCNPKIKRAKG